MKCWKCGQENVQNVSQCVYCGAGMNRPEPETEIGAALRQLYDHYGAEKMLTNPLLMVNGLGDLVQDNGKFRSQLKMALDAGIGKVYLEQIRTAGKPDYNFDSRVLAILIEDAELSEPAANKIMDAMDEMIGWQAPAQIPSQPAPKAPVQPPVQVNRPSETEYTLPDLDSEKKTRWPLILIALLVVAVAAFLIANQSQGWVPVPWATSTPSPSPTPTPVPETPTPTPTPVPETPSPTPTPTPCTPTPSPEPTPTHKPEIGHYNGDGSLMYTEYYNGAGELIKTIYEPEVNYYNEDGSLYYTDYYNEIGQIIKTVFYDGNGKYEMVIYSEFNESGIKTLMRREDYSEGSLKGYSIMEYNANGKMVLVRNFNASGIITSKQEYGPEEELKRSESYGNGIIERAYERNSIGLVAKEEVYTNGKMDYYRLYEYDDNGNQTKSTVCESDGSVRAINRRVYDSNNSLTEETNYDAEGNLKDRSVYANKEKVKYERYKNKGQDLDYDEEYQDKKKIKTTYYESGAVKSYWRYYYNSDGKLIKEEFYRGNELEIIYKYEYGTAREGYRIKKEYDKDGNLVKETEVKDY